MTADRGLIGRADLLSRVRSGLGAHRNLLLIGPKDVGKTALIRAALEGPGPSSLDRAQRAPSLDSATAPGCSSLAAPAPLVIDPFEHVSSLRAARIRRQLDRRQLVVAAARALDRRTLGAVGRILWRFEVLRVGPLSGADIRRLLRRELTRSSGQPDVDRTWLSVLAHEAQGLPGRACALAAAAARYQREHGVWPATEWVVVEAAVTSWSALDAPRSSSGLG